MKYKVLLLVGCWLLFAGKALAQEEAFTLHLSRDFGYGGLNGDIEGTFSYRVDEIENLLRVEFLLDGMAIGMDEEPPFQLQFHTGSYDLGPHQLQAKGYLSNGQSLESNVITRNFVEPTDVWNIMKRILVPLFVVIGLAVLVPANFSIIDARRNPITLGAKRKYHWLLGGAICTQCQRPFSIHFWNLKLGIGRLDRCPHCGKWHFIQRANSEQLRAAEVAELSLNQLDIKPEKSEGDKLSDLLEDTRYTDH